MRATEIITKIKEDKHSMEFMPSGFRAIDEALDGGFLRKELVILGGSTGIGKSYIAGQVLFNIARKGYRTAYFSLEITNEMVISRLLGQLADIKSTRISAGMLSDREINKYSRSIGQLIAHNDYMEFFDHEYEMTGIEKQIRDNNYDFVVVDFIQNVNTPKEKEYDRLSYVALSFQKLAKEKNLCIMVLSQLSNFVARETQDPILEYKGSGSIATVADLGFFVIRGDHQLEPEKLYVILKKNRRGISGLKFDFMFKGEGGLIT